MKRYTVIFSPLAMNEVEQTVDHYNKQQAGLGKRFAARVQLTLNAIKRNPFFASLRYDDIRCTALKEISLPRTLSYR